MAMPAPAVPVSSAPAIGGNTCPSCGAVVIPGEAFCEGCGAQLSTAGPVPISMPPSPPSVVQPQTFYPQPQQSGGSYSPPLVSSTPAQIVAKNGQIFTLAGKPKYTVGREDAVSGIFPDIDTTSSGGEEGGVSREHAEVVYQGGQWLICALRTTNLTYVNNQEVLPSSVRPLNPGDQIRLGKWIATFQM